MKHPEELDSRRKEIIEALNKTAKPYFGDLASMTYLEWARRFAELAFPWADPTYADRFQHLLQRIEARVNDTDSGEFTSKLFAADGVSAEEAAAADLLTHDDILADPAPALEKLALAYPQTAELKVVPADVAWFPVLVREYPKPMPFVPVIDNDLLRWWGQDQLWQSEDQRYSADSVRAIPGPISVAGITTIDEPIADILGRFETAAIKRVQDEQQAADAAENDDFAALGEATSAEDFIRKSPNISWVGHITDNPAYGTALGDQYYEIRAFDAAAGKYDLDIHLDTYWDNDPDGGTSKHAVKVIGLGAGADDYMTKPFSMRELIARCKALLRRVDRAKVIAKNSENEKLLDFGSLVIDPAQRIVTVNGKQVHLTPTEFDLLATLARKPKSVLTREKLLEEVWDWVDASGTRTVDSHVKALRHKLGSKTIRTVHGVGYAFEPPEVQD